MHTLASVPQSKPSPTENAAPVESNPDPLRKTIGKAAGKAKASDLRLRKHADYQRAYKATRKQFSSSMSWFLALRSMLHAAPALPLVSPSPRVGLTVGKVLGKAHERNLIKRRMREAVRHGIHELPEGIDLILHPKRSVMTMDFGKLEAEVLRIFRQAATQTRETAARVAQSKPVKGPEVVQSSGQSRAPQPNLKPDPKQGQKPDLAQVPGESVTRS